VLLQPLHVIKCHDRVSMVAINKEPKFFQLHDEQWLPILRLLHQCQWSRGRWDVMIARQIVTSLCRRTTQRAFFVSCCVSLSSPDPDLLPTVQVDRGAIKFVLKGADIMAPGLTSAGGSLGSAPLVVGDYVAVRAEGKEQILAIGRMTMSSDDVRKVNKGTAIENLHFLNDGLWNTASIE